VSVTAITIDTDIRRDYPGECGKMRNPFWSKRHVGTSIIILILATISAGGCNGGGTNTVVIYSDRSGRTIEIGGIMALSEGSPVWGRSCLKALQFAEADVNEELEEQGSDMTVRFVYGDSDTKPPAATTLMKSFISQGVRAVIGPLTSDELSAMQETVDQSDSIVISPSSTLPSLAVTNDNIFRLTPNDDMMVEGIVQLLSDRGIQSLVVLYVEDLWGESLLDSLTAAFTGAGGTVLEALSYYTLRPDVLQAQLDELSRAVANQVAMDGPATVGFMLIGYAECQGIMELASADAVLGQVRWFGTDGFVNYGSVLSDQTVAAFATQTKYTAPSLNLALTDDGAALKERIETATGLPATVYSLLAYDAFRVAAQVLLNSTSNVAIDDLRDNFFSEFALYEGTTGVIILNDAGDRDNGRYYFWQVTNPGGTYQWEHVYTFEKETTY
jgi:branched-chain amino acid transport system substrate-binding protein